MDNTTKFECRFCVFISSSLTSHLQHQTQHRHISKLFHCGFKKCKLSFQSESCLRMHIIRRHNFYVSRVPRSCQGSAANSQAQLLCPLEFCKKEFINQKILLGHLKQHIKDGISSPCPFDQCTKQFKNINSFTGHISRSHRQLVTEFPLECQHLQDPLEAVMSHSHMNTTMNHTTENSEGTSTAMTTENENTETQQPVIDVSGSLIALAQFYMKLECKYLVPESTVQYVADELKVLFMESEKGLLKKLEDALKEEGLSPVTINYIKSTCADEVDFACNSEKLRSSYLRKEFYKRHFTYVEPKKLPLDRNGSFFYYVPIEDSLKACFKNKSFNIDVNAQPDSDSETLRDFTDGLAFKQNPFFQENPKSVKIILYQDSFELVCPIGPARNRKHKILAVYMAIGNLKPEERFQKDAIQLVALCKEKEFNHAEVYGKIVEDIEKLQTEGMDISGHGNVKAGLAFVAGDNLGSHSLGGFVESFSKAFYFCRYCLVHRNLFHAEGGESTSYPERTVQSYRNALRKVKRHPTTGKIIANKGVKFNSVFNRIQGFHVCPAGLPPCLGHDVMEGIIAYDLMLFIKYFISKGWFTLQQLNELIEKFPYSEDDKRDRPASVPEDKKRLVGGAWQLWTFLRLFPLIVMHCIKDANDPVWMCMLNLIEITKHIVAPEINVSHLAYLDNIIQNYIISRKDLFPGSRLKPKHHYLTHYPELIVRFGPLIKVWTLRFESKHTYFKQAWKAGRNSINILYSLSQKHEMLQAFLRSGANLRQKVLTSSRTVFVPLMYSHNIVLSVKSSFGTLSDLEDCNTVTVNGTMYRKGNVLVLGTRNFDHQLVIGCILLILVDFDQNVKFVVREGTATLKYHVLLHQVSYNDTMKCISITEPLTYYPHHVYTINTVPYICLKHSLIGQKLEV